MNRDAWVCNICGTVVSDDQWRRADPERTVCRHSGDGRKPARMKFKKDWLQFMPNQRRLLEEPSLAEVSSEKKSPIEAPDETPLKIAYGMITTFSLAGVSFAKKSHGEEKTKP